MQNQPHPRLNTCRADSRGYCYFITTVTAERKTLFNQPQAAQIVLDTMHWLESQKRYSLWAAVVMPDHIHFVATLASAIDNVMHALKSFSAHRINRTLEYYGPVWQAGYFDHGVIGETQLRNAVRYCVDNPVRAGLVADARQYRFTYCRFGITAELDSF